MNALTRLGLALILIGLGIVISSVTASMAGIALSAPGGLILGNAVVVGITKGWSYRGLA